ncbi:MAG TPA: protein kinase [Candidatus Acidoferrales bacterium]|nr:protein kinase [Candidatus Acidoferrales bacterium]
MQCPICSTKNPDTSWECGKCHTLLGGEGSQVTLDQGTPEEFSVALSPETAAHLSDADTLQPGTVLAGRYEILQLIGQGGMGAVYKAHDRELDRAVAVKTIRPNLAKNADTLRRFKQELILARQVTHRNVIRIHDLGQSDGIKFITMDFVEGRDLRSLFNERGKFEPKEATLIMLQICRALEAAHNEGVIHRDLKPQNIMRDPNGRIYVMDFGIARSAYLPGMTQTGALLGTPEYMSPEQARGEKLTEQSDIFSLGVIFYELLTGKSPYHSDVPLATLWKRMQEKATPPIEVDPSIPQALSDIVVTALEIEPAKRFATAGEMAQSLEIWLGPSSGGSTIIMQAPPRTAAHWKWAAGALAVLLIVAVIFFRFRRPAPPKAAHAPLSVLVGDFNNYTGDPIFDDTLEPMFNVALEGASFITAYNRGQARSEARQLQPKSGGKLDEQSARLVAISAGVNAIVTGSLSSRGNGYQLSVEAIDASSGKMLASSNITAADKNDLLLDIPKLAAPIRKALGDSTPESVQLAATQGAFASSNLEAAHQYGLGMEDQFAGNMKGAVASFGKAVELDPSFARAYAGMAGASYALGNIQDVAKNAKLAMEHVDRMTDRERYRIRGFFYLAVARDFPQCVEENTALVKAYPSDNLGHINLAVCYSELRNYSKAAEEFRRAVEIYPKAIIPRMDLALASSYAGDFQTAEQQARAVIQMNPSFEVSYFVLAYAQLGQGHLDQAAETYQKLEKLSPRGASMGVAGLADLALYQGRFSEAVRLLEDGAKVDLATKDSRAPEKFAELAYAQLSWGHKPQAVEAVQHALSISQRVDIRFLMARVLIESGQEAKARTLGVALASESTGEAQADAKLIAGEIALKAKDTGKAIQLFTDAQKVLDTWMGRFDLGRAYLAAGQYVEADSQFDRCIKTRGEALEFLGSPTFGYFPPVYYYQGRVREGLKSPGAADSFRTYLSIRGKANEDPLLPELRRLAQ